MNLGKTIGRLRTEAGLSQSDLADELGVSRQSVSKWETGAAVPELDKLVKISELFQISLDQLIKGDEPAQQSEPTQSSKSEATQKTPRTRIQTVGVVLLCISAVLACVFGVWGGPAGMLFALPTMLPGLICYFAQNHPGLKAVWTEYLMFDAITQYTTRIRVSNIWLTLQWSYEMNYFVLVCSWVMFLVLASLVTGTALVLRKEDWNGTRRQKGAVILSLLGLLITSRPVYRVLWMPIIVSLQSNFWISISMVALNWIKLGAIIVLVTAIVRYIRTRKAKNRAV